MKVHNYLFLLLVFSLFVVGIIITVGNVWANEEGGDAVTTVNSAVKNENVNSDAAPKIQFLQKNKIFDLGTFTQMTKVSKIVKFKNVGKGILKIEKVKPG